MSEEMKILTTKVRKEITDKLRNDVERSLSRYKFFRLSFLGKNKIDYQEKHQITLELLEKFSVDIFNEKYGNLLAAKRNKDIEVVHSHLKDHHDDWVLQEMNTTLFLKKDKNSFYVFIINNKAKIQRLIEQAYTDLNLNSKSEIKAFVDNKDGFLMPRIYIYKQTARNLYISEFTFEYSSIEESINLTIKNKGLFKKTDKYKIKPLFDFLTKKTGIEWITKNEQGKVPVKNNPHNKAQFGLELTVQDSLYAINKALVEITKDAFFEELNGFDFKEGYLPKGLKGVQIYSSFIDKRQSDLFMSGGINNNNNQHEKELKFHKEKIDIEIVNNSKNKSTFDSFKKKVRRKSSSFEDSLSSINFSIVDKSPNVLIIQDDITKKKTMGQHLTIADEGKINSIKDRLNIARENGNDEDLKAAEKVLLEIENGEYSRFRQSLNEFRKRGYEQQKIDYLGVKKITISGTITSIIGSGKERERDAILSKIKREVGENLKHTYCRSSNNVKLNRESPNQSGFEVFFDNGIKISSSQSYLSVFTEKRDKEVAFTGGLDNYYAVGRWSLEKSGKNEYFLNVFIPSRHLLSNDEDKARRQKQRKIQRYVVKTPPNIIREELVVFLKKVISSQIYYPKNFTLSSCPARSPFLYFIKNQVEQLYR